MPELLVLEIIYHRNFFLSTDIKVVITHLKICTDSSLFVFSNLSRLTILKPSIIWMHKVHTSRIIWLHVLGLLWAHLHLDWNVWLAHLLKFIGWLHNSIFRSCVQTHANVCSLAHLSSWLRKSYISFILRRFHLCLERCGRVDSSILSIQIGGNGTFSKEYLLLIL